MKPLRTLLLLYLSWGTPTLGQSTTVPVSISLSSPSPTCMVSSDVPLNYGTVEKPSTGSKDISISAVSGDVTTDLLRSGSSSVGQVRLRGENVSSYTVSRTFPSNLENSGETLSFSGRWAQSGSSGSGYARINSASYFGTASGAGSSFSRYFRFGGTVSGITLSDDNGTYTGTITVTATCS